jgi:cytochrome P450
MFIYQLAGHETSAHTLAFAFVMLALYPAKQEKLYEHIKSVLPVGRSPVSIHLNCFIQVG